MIYCQSLESCFFWKEYVKFQKHFVKDKYPEETYGAGILAECIVYVWFFLTKKVTASLKTSQIVLLICREC